MKAVEIGRIGEAYAAKFLKKQGYRILAKNNHQSHNEIDLILQSSTHLAFVEVKTRHSVPGARNKYGRPADAVNKAKRAHIVQAAKDYLRDHPTNLQPRLDIAEVYVTRLADGTHQITSIRVFPNAFGARG